MDFFAFDSRYTSYLAPVSSSRLHSEARAQAYSPSSPTDGPEGQPYGTLRALETPYVVRAHSASQTHVEKPCFTFNHPKTFYDSAQNNSDDNGNENITDTLSADMIQSSSSSMTASNVATATALATASGIINPSQTILAAMDVDNDRYSVLEFPFDPFYGAGSGCGYGSFDSAVATMAQTSPGANNTTGQATNLNIPIGTSVHGFFGSFEAILYRSKVDNVTSTISIVPSSFSEGMFSWFPLFFPLRNAIFVPAGDTLRCAFWRKTDCEPLGGRGRVWYEWCCEVIRREENNPGHTKESVITATPVHNPNGRSYHVRL